ncbi:MAG: LrgB family protein [Magnetospirillum gryphiswaldense]|nr:LrgB family protein [Magnetospirillum gryphiswaldense]
MAQLWAVVDGNPLTWLTLTLVVYQAAHWVWRRGRMNPLLNPVLLSIATLSAVLTLGGVDYARYFSGAQLIHFLLGPATVALAIPLYRQLGQIMRSAGALAAGLLCGSVAAILASLGIGWALGASPQTIMSMAPKSVTSPIAMGVAEQIGGLPSLTAVLVILTGITGAVGGAWLLDRLRVKDERARGVAIGTASHGIGTARALQMGEVTGAFSGLAMGLNGVATALLTPIIVKWLFG